MTRIGTRPTTVSYAGCAATRPTRRHPPHHVRSWDAPRRRDHRRRTQRPDGRRLPRPRRPLRAAPRARRPRGRCGRLGPGLRGRRRPAVPLLVPREPAPPAHHRRPRAGHPARASPLLVVHARPDRPLARAAHRPRGRRRGIRHRLRARRRRGRRRRLGGVLRRDRRAGGTTLPDAHRAAAHAHRGARARGRRPGLGRLRRATARQRHRRALHERPRARRRRDRRPHRHLHRPRRPGPRRQPLLPLPRDRRRHRRLGRARSAAWAR